MDLSIKGDKNMRLLMKVQKSGFDWNYTNMYPIVHTNVPDFLLELELAVIDWIDNHNSVHAEMRQEHDRYNSLNSNEKRLLFKTNVLEPIYAKVRALNDSTITVGSNVIKVDDVLDNDTALSFNAPTVFVVDDLFATLEA